MYSAYEQVQAAFDGTLESIEDAASVYESENNIEVMVWQDSLIWYTSYDRFLYGSGNHQLNGGAEINLPTITGQVQQTPQTALFELQPSVQTEGRSPQGQTNGDVSQADELDEYRLDIQSEAQLATQPEMQVLHFVDAFEYEGVTYTVTLTLSLDSIESSAEVFSSSSMVISVIALLIGFGYSLILSKSITKPILEMEQIAGQFANLDFSHKANEDVAATELYHLSKSLNSMSTQLEKSITSLNIANEKLKQDIDYQKQVEQMRREFVGNVSHEMKTPLTMLQIYAESLKYNIDSVDKDYYCDTIMEETETLNDLVASMLDISSIESGLSKMQMDEVDLSMLLTSLLGRMRPLFEGYHIAVTIAPDLSLLGDEKYLEQAMKNYITNALEHTEQGKSITICLAKEQEGITYCVENEGAVIPPEVMPRLWDSFYRADKARSRGNKNVGLGLHIVKTVIEKHEGTCDCLNSETGVRFAFWLPQREGEQSDEASQNLITNECE
ncbi:MAG: ATP-binding protein [Faecalibacterium sp.]